MTRVPKYRVKAHRRHRVLRPAMLRKTAACGIVGVVAAITAALLWWPMDVAVAPAPRARVQLKMPERLFNAPEPAKLTFGHSPIPAPRAVRRPVGIIRPDAGAGSLTTLAAGVGRKADLANAPPPPLESRFFVGATALTPGPLPMPVLARPETGGSAMARTGRTLGSAFKTTGASLTAAFSRLF